MFKEDVYANEFFGRIVRFYVENDTIWAYDELSMGLYEINLNTRRAELLLTHLQIHKDKCRIICGLIKKENEIVLVPKTVDDNWVVYKIKEKEVSYIHPVLLKMQISELHQYENMAYMIPEKINDPICVISLDNMECVKQIKHWYDIDDEDITSYSCWGTSVNENGIYVPVVEKKYISKIRYDKTEFILADIPESIHAISVSKDGIWILPMLGNYIYQIDQTGNLINCIEVNGNEENSVKQFARIISIEDYIFLVPFYKKDIYVYRKIKKDFLKISSKTKLHNCAISMKINSDYWGFYINNKTLSLLPLRYRWTMIDLQTLEITDTQIVCKDNYVNEDLKLYLWKNKTSKYLMFNDNGDNALDEYIQLVDKISNIKKCDYMTNVGNQIWKCFKE